MNVRLMEKQITDYIVNNKANCYRLAYSYVRNSEDALDVVQESICKALSSIGSIRDSAGIKTWLYRIVVNTSLDVIRKRSKVVGLDENALETIDPGGNDKYRDIDLQRALDSLPVQYRSVIVLRYFEDLKIEEIALVQRENINTVKTRLYQALRKLHDKMADDGEES